MRKFVDTHSFSDQEFNEKSALEWTITLASLIDCLVTFHAAFVKDVKILKRERK